MLRTLPASLTKRMSAQQITSLILACCIAAALSQGRALSQTPPKKQMDSLTRRLSIQLTTLTSPALEERKRVRLAMQRSGYSNVLSDALNGDGLSALISYIKTKLNIEYSISHRPLSIQIPIGGAKKEKNTAFNRKPPSQIEQIITESRPEDFWEVTLYDNWAFPPDPWKKK
jgi:hypothetical protein